MSMAAISAGASAASSLVSIAGTVAQIKDTNKRREFQQKLDLLDLDQRAKLERELQATTSSNKRLEILTNAVATIKAAQSSSILSATIQSRALAKSKKETTMAIAIIGGAVVILGAIALLKK